MQTTYCVQKGHALIECKFPSGQNWMQIEHKTILLTTCMISSLYFSSISLALIFCLHLQYSSGILYEITANC